MKYSIILSKTATEREIFACNEFEYYLKQITNAEILKDTMDADVVFSIGNTDLLKTYLKEKVRKRATPKNEDFSEVFFDDENNVYMLSGTSEYATMFGVYELLKALFGV